MYFAVAEKEKRATAVALKLENERRAGETARLAKAEQHRAVQQHQKQAAQEVMHLCCFALAVISPSAAHACHTSFSAFSPKATPAKALTSTARGLFCSVSYIQGAGIYFMMNCCSMYSSWKLDWLYAFKRQHSGV